MDIRLDVDNARIVPARINVDGGPMGLIRLDMAGGGAIAPAYRGPYTVVPEAYFAQTLETEGKRMKHDVVVEEVPYFLTTNEAGGYTASICS